MSASSASGVPAPAPAPAPPAAPLRPSVFAIMRHSHAVLRGALADLHDALPPAAEGAFADVRGAAAAAPEAAGAMGAFEAEWSAYKRFQALHARMEDGVHDKRAKLVAGGLWAILDVQFDDLAAKSGFRNLHAQVEKLERRVADAVRARSAPRLRAAWDAYQAKDEQHLALEEKLAGPALRQLPARGVELRQEMQAHILPGARAAARRGAVPGGGGARARGTPAAARPRRSGPSAPPRARAQRHTSFFPRWHARARGGRAAGRSGARVRDGLLHRVRAGQAGAAPPARHARARVRARARRRRKLRARVGRVAAARVRCALGGHAAARVRRDRDLALGRGCVPAGAGPGAARGRAHGLTRRPPARGTHENGAWRVRRIRFGSGSLGVLPLSHAGPRQRECVIDA